MEGQVPSAYRQKLADDIRAGASAYIRAATEAFGRRMALEYHRMRGHALEQGSMTMTLNVHVTLSFDPAKRSVTVQTVPIVHPQAGVTTAPVHF